MPMPPVAVADGHSAGHVQRRESQPTTDLLRRCNRAESPDVIVTSLSKLRGQCGASGPESEGWTEEGRTPAAARPKG
jgi:hypothetical protein